MKSFTTTLLILVLSTAAFADVIYSEDFETGTIPTNWQLWQEGPTSTVQWKFDQTGMPHGGTYYMFHGYDAANNLDNWVVTQTFDMSGWENLSVTFWHCGSFAAYYGYTGLMGSTTENPTAGDFSEIVEIGAPPAYYTELIVDCSVYDAESFITFAWRYTGLDAHTVRVDDVQVEGDVNAGIESASFGEIKATFK
ncbi:MAG: hypothetical protein GY771_06230 [bacterium]|nr:hypothetical protein [bacterium]